MGMSGDPVAWRFLPLLSPQYAVYLPWLNLWWGAVLLLHLLLIGLGRWNLALRWADLAVRALGTAVLYRLLTGPPILGHNPGWAAAHPWLKGSSFW
jgi:hypothetical protein